MLRHIPWRRCLVSSFILLFGLVVHAAEPVRPVQQQTREFEIFVDGSKSGTNRLTISEFADGRTVATTDANVSISFVVYTYTYRYQGAETWHDDQPRRIEGQTTESGKKRVVRAVAKDRQLRVALDDGPAKTTAAVPLTTNFWCWPEALDDQREITALDVDKGKPIQIKCERLANEAVTVDGCAVRCSHYRLSGGVTAELWFDADRQLIRQKSLEEGHPTELKLVSIKRTSPAAPRTARND